MNSKNKINNALFSSLNENIRDPFLVLDHNGKILSINREAESLLSLKAERPSIFDLFDESSGNKLNEIIEEVFISSIPIVKNIHLTLIDGSELSTQIVINSYKEEEELFIFCTLRPQTHQIELKGITNYKVIYENIKKIISNDEILKILDEIKSLYPFTYIGKERILKKLNALEELFWIKDINGVYIIVNEKFASGLGLKSSQIEGNPAESFAPSFTREFRNAVENYIKQSINSVIIEGTPVLGIAMPGEYQTIEIPLVDTDNNVIAIIGIGQLKEKQDTIPEEESFNTDTNIIADFSKALAFVDKNGKIKQSSKEFCKLFSDEFSDLKNFYYTKVVPIKLYEKIQRFLNSTDTASNFEYDFQFAGSNNIIQNKIVYLNKILGEENKIEGFSILIDDALQEENLEQLIIKRGRMFEVLIQNNPEPIFIYDTENLRFIEVNDAALALYGYRKDEFLQMDLTDLYTPEDIQTLLDSSFAAAKEGKFTGPYKHKKKDGSYVFVEISKINFKFNEKDAHFNIIKDVSEKLEADKRNQLFKSAFENTGDLLFITDNAGFINYFNMPVKTILGYSKQDLENSLFSALVKNDDRGTVNSSIFQSHLIEPVTITTELKKHNEKYVECELTASPVLNYKNEIETFCIICKVNLKEGQEEKTKEVIKEVIIEKPGQDGSKSAEPADLNFLSGLFHELLTPINVILGFVQELSEGFENPTSEQKEAMDIINQNRDRLLNIMNSIVEYTNIQKNELELTLQDIGITEIIDKLQNDFNQISGSDEMEFAYGKISSSLHFKSDMQKFQNLMYQIVKVVTILDKGKKIYFSAYQISDNEFIVSVKDNYSSVSSYLLDSLKTVFQEKTETTSQELGIPKLTLRLSRLLLTTLNGKFAIIDQKTDKADYGFIFPLELSYKEKMIEEIEESVPEKITEPEVETASEIPEIEEENEVGDVPQTNEPAEEDIQVPEEAETPVEENIKSEKDILDFEPVEQKTADKTFNKLDISEFSCLYIEDQIDSQILFKVQMKELKEIQFAIGFEEALPLLDSSHFDFIVMDINLQGEYNGLDALKIIHRMPGYERIPIIAVTAYVLPGDKEKFIATGFHDFISKPIFKEKMIDSLEKIFTNAV